MVCDVVCGPSGPPVHPAWIHHCGLGDPGPWQCLVLLEASWHLPQPRFTWDCTSTQQWWGQALGCLAMHKHSCPCPQETALSSHALPLAPPPTYQAPPIHCLWRVAEPGGGATVLSLSLAGQHLAWGG